MVGVWTGRTVASQEGQRLAEYLVSLLKLPAVWSSLQTEAHIYDEGCTRIASLIAYLLILTEMRKSGESVRRGQVRHKSRGDVSWLLLLISSRGHLNWVTCEPEAILWMSCRRMDDPTLRPLALSGLARFCRVTCAGRHCHFRKESILQLTSGFMDD